MAQLLPLPAELCTELTIGPGEICIEIVGGAKLCVTDDLELGDPSVIARKFIGMINGALAPLGPFFRILDVIALILECIQAIPDAVGPPPQPQKLLQCIPGLVEKVNQLLQLLPPMSVPVMIKSILSAMIVYLEGLKAEIEALGLALQRVLAASLRAAELGNLELQFIADCAQDNFDVQLANLNQAAAPLNRLMGLINFLLELAGVPCITIPLGELPPATQAALDVIQFAIDVLTAARNAIPVLDLTLEPIPDTSEPC